MSMNRTVDFNMSPLPTARSTILPNGARVACWPSTGGMWIKHAPQIELDFLYLSRTNDTAKPIPKMMGYQYPIPPDIDREAMDEYAAWHPGPISDEDLFCEKMRMVGADFWTLPPVQDLKGTPIEYFLVPKYRNELGFHWNSWSSTTYVVNLTEAAEKFGPDLKGYNNATSIFGRWGPVNELGGSNCLASEEQGQCQKMWCSQYPEHCHEIDWENGMFFTKYIAWTGYNWYGVRGLSS
jgi:hypothetical protein